MCNVVIAKESYGFTTECFFLTLRAYHVGFISAFTRYERFIRKFQDLRNERDELLAQRPQWFGVCGAQSSIRFTVVPPNPSVPIADPSSF
jgi:hypothetical protein